VPADKCHYSHMSTAASSLGGDLSHTVSYTCWLFSWSSKNPDNSARAWDTCWNPWGPYGCTQDAGTLLDRFRYHIENKVWSKSCSTCSPRYFLADQITEVATTWVRESNHNGIASGWVSLNSEITDDGWDWNPEHTIVKHELAHLLGAGHFPDNGWRLYVCNWPHWHGWYDHWHSTRSVMNYCWAGLHDYMGWGVDSNGLATVQANAADTTPCSSSGPPKPYWTGSSWTCL
jgi:hypothetical protein